MKHDIDNQASALATRMDLLHCPESTWTLVHNRLETGPSFFPPHVILHSNSLPGFADGDRQTDLNQTLPIDSESR